MNKFKKNIFRTSNTATSVLYSFSIGKESQGLSCMEINFPITLYSTSNSIIVGTAFFSDSGLTIPFDGSSYWYKNGIYSYIINASGIVTSISALCSTLLPLTRYCFEGTYNETDPIHVPPGGVVNYEDEFGNPQTRSMITIQSGTVSIFSSSIPSIDLGCIEVTCPI